MGKLDEITLKQRIDWAARFLENTVAGPNGCILWTKSCGPDGYGIFTIGTSTSDEAHRVAFRLFIGTIPDGQCVLHHCDNPPCVNPQHFFLGTRTDNNKDRHAKGRTVLPTRRARGEEASKAKLTVFEVLHIREAFSSGLITKSELARCYNVTASAIHSIIIRENWKHV